MVVRNLKDDPFLQRITQDMKHTESCNIIGNGASELS